VNVSKISFNEALSLTFANVTRLGSVLIPVMNSVGRTAAEDVAALVDSPSVDASIKDGYAVVSNDVKHASVTNPVTLEVIGSLGAGENSHVSVKRGKAIRVLSGAPIPDGCDAVLADEFAQSENRSVTAVADAHPGRNILFKGVDVKAGETLVIERQEITPPVVGLLVAGGVSEIKVARLPRVGLLATGDEVLMPGRQIEKGKLYASNLALQQAWLTSRSIPTVARIANDSFNDLTRVVESMLSEIDVIITSGGAWKGDRDLVISVLESLGWKRIFHKIKLGPGKAIGMGILNGKAIFCLPGGPPSNEAAFLLIAFPAVCRIAGHEGSPFMRLTGRLESEITGQKTWTQVIHCTIKKQGNEFHLTPLEMKRRLVSMARAQAIVLIPEGIEKIPAGSEVDFILL